MRRAIPATGPATRWASLCALGALGAVTLGAGCAASLTGVVYIDRNGDRVRQDDEPVVPDAIVMLDHGTAAARTDRRGVYSLDAPAGGAIVWVRVPAGFRPGPVWTRVGGNPDLPLTPLSAEEDARPLTFVVASDTHTTSGTGPWDGGDLADAIAQALALPEPPRFFTIVGDVTQANRAEEFRLVEEALAGVSVPWVPVAGNHDWYDGGRAWRARWGPDSYSFDVGELHVIVWDTNLPEDDQLAFFRADLAGVTPGTVVVALGHASPREAVADQLAALGVDYLFTGHWHANRRVERTGLVEWGTQTLIMGTIDQSPAGYRIVTFAGGAPIVEHRARLVQPHLAVTAPHAGSCTPPGAPLDVLVSAALDAAAPAVTARVDCGPELPLAPRGGWSFGARLPALAPGTHRLTVAAAAPSGRRAERELTFEVCAPALGAPAAGSWPQLGGGPAHTGAAPAPIAPPLQQAWATTVGGHVALGSPVVAGGTVVVSVWDLGAGDGGGLVALDLATGAERWRYTTPFQARNAPAIDGDTVVVALGNGEVHALGLAGGDVRWIHHAADGLDPLAASLWAPPAIAAGVVYVAVQGRMSALDLATGEPRWTRELTPTYAWLGTTAAVTVADGKAIANYARQDGTTAWAAATGTKQWELRSALSVAVNATPVAQDGELYLASSAGAITKLSLATGAVRWSTSVTPGASDWDYTVTATPVLAGGRLFVPTQYEALIALDAATGAELWRYATPGGPLQLAHYRASTPGFAASPVATGDLLWVPRPDGVLAALAADDGRELWTTQLGAPIVSAPAPAGSYLVVATFDGTVRALVPAPAVTPAPLPACAPLDAPADPPAAAGCCDVDGSPASAIALAGPIALAWLARRRRRRRA
jgi:MYXO-CTERM domain-containing protein